MSPSSENPLIAIGCGGTGGHLFPGLAVAHLLQEWGCDVALLVSKKEVDQEAVKSAAGMRVIALPAVGLQGRRWWRFLKGSLQSYQICMRAFQPVAPRAVLAMGGFTSAPPILAGKRLGAATFLHESNTIPGRANRWLAPWVSEVFVGFGEATRRLSSQRISVVGTPVRAQFKRTEPEACRMSLGLQPSKPVLLVMGGSQGASGINQLVMGAIPILAEKAPDLQFLHLTGPEDCPKVQAVYGAHQRRALVRPFFTEMELVLGATTMAVNRAGASSLAELAAMRIPALLIPYPYATDDHQLYNARAYAQVGAARLIEQFKSTPEKLAAAILDLLQNDAARQAMQQALEQWSFPNAARDIASHIFNQIGLPTPAPVAEEDDTFRLPPPRWSGAKPPKPPGLKFISTAKGPAV